MQVRLAHLRPDFWAIFLFSGLRDGRASPYQLNGGTKWVQYFFFDLRDDISYVQILYNAKWSYLCISDISAVLGNNNQKKIWFLDDNIWFDAVKETIQENKMEIFDWIFHDASSIKVFFIFYVYIVVYFHLHCTMLLLSTRMLRWSKFPMYFGQLLQEHI